MERQLAFDIGRSIDEFQAVAKSLELKNKLYRVLFRGKGLEFNGFRQYGPDDDASEIDWMSSIRSGKILVKQYKEERKIKFVFVVDVGNNMVSGTTCELKCEYVCNVFAALANLILDVGDQVGLLLYHDGTYSYTPPSSGNTHFGLLISKLSNGINYGGSPDFPGMLHYIIDNFNEGIKVVIFISDFLFFKPNECVPLLRLIGAKHEVFSLIVKDPLDKDLPDMHDEVIITDPSMHQYMVVNPSVVRKSYQKYAAEQESAVRKAFTQEGMDVLSLMTDKPFAYLLGNFLQERVKKIF